jgi:hypothetical protein
MTIHEAYRMRHWDEILGHVHRIEELDDYCLALIGKILVTLPKEMATRLKETKGQRIGILRTDRDYRLRVINPKPDTGSKPLSIAECAL